MADNYGPNNQRRSLPAELAYDSGQHSADIPSAAVSEAKIAEKAPVAISVLKKLQALDLVEALGLGPYLEEGQHGTS